MMESSLKNQVPKNNQMENYTSEQADYLLTDKNIRRWKRCSPKTQTSFLPMEESR